MQKFTAFSILLSIVVVLTTVDVLFHDYLSDGEIAVVQEEVIDSATSNVGDVDANVDSTVDTSETTSPVELQEETISSWFTADLLSQAGFMQPVVKEALFSGLIFQIVPFNNESDTQTMQLNFFDGETYVGTFYEMVYATDTGSFQGYLSLREAAKTLTDLGTANEVNMYGDASFYFNHKTKIKTVHMVALYGNRVLGFEYSQSEHEKMKKLFDILGTLQ